MRQVKSSGGRLSDRAAVGVPANVIAAHLGRMAESGLSMRIPNGGIVRPRVEDRLTGARRCPYSAPLPAGAPPTAASETAPPMA